MQVRYQLLGPLFPGEGANRPHLALSLEEGKPPRPVVLIWAPAEIAQDAAALARLRKETERAVVFEHPNILRVHALVTLDGRVARVTEYADGEPLRHVLEGCPRLPPLFAALIAMEAATGVHYAHVAGNDDGTPYVHGDLRPETLMISAQGQVKVTGYGALGVAPREKDGRRVRNRRLYSAPEQLLGGREASSVPTDVFLLGLLLHECLSGRKPFQDSIDRDKAILSRPLPPLPEDVPLAYNEIIRRATAKRSKERYPTALAFREALEALVGEPPSPTALAEFLIRQIPHDNEMRRFRKAMIERGMAELAQNTPPALPAPVAAGAVAPPAGAPVYVAPPPGTPVYASPPPGMPGYAPPPPGAAGYPVAPPTSAMRSRLAVGALAFVGTLFFVSAVGFIWKNVQHEPEYLGPDAGVAADVNTPMIVEEVPAPSDAGVAVAPSAPPKAGASAPLTPVQIFVTPEVMLYVDGRQVGRSPQTVPMTPGRHLISLVDANRGLRTARSIDVRATQEKVQFNMRVNLGSVLILAESGAKVFLDGQPLGVAPVAEYPVFEGEHHVRVINPDKSVQERDFVMPGSPPGERIVLNAKTSDGSEGVASEAGE
ncbi:serine/threonine protein kinase [Cystobacter fuscus]|uniref:serine/threonine protein kinase n=1 Tax=Cystobacter fuscus TaxID=43 RepID=UPI002B325ACD|nr:protein kinase [Cystobacter fuscus]